MYEMMDEMIHASDRLMYKLRRDEYEARMKEFSAQYNILINEMFDNISAAEDQSVAALEIGNYYCDRVRALNEKRGRIRRDALMQLTLFTVDFVFPSILLTMDERAKTLCDGIRDAWRVKFDNPVLDYTDYDTIYAGFKGKLFGVF